MLVLTRKTEEKIYVGNDIVITIVQVRGDRVRVGIEAPKHVRVLREEVANAIKEKSAESGEATQLVAADLSQELSGTQVANTVVNAVQPKSSPLASRIAHRRMLGDGLTGLKIEPVGEDAAARRAPGASFTTTNRFSQHLGPASLMTILDRFKDLK